ncbi:MAG TPA: PDGLE domain-containing protein [Actinomycetota bacterium]
MDRKNVLLFLIGGLVVAAGLAFFVSPLASGSPDGLNRVAIDKGIDSTEQPHAVGDGPLAGYEVKGVGGRGLSKGLSGVIGVGITFGSGMILFGFLRLSRARREAREGSGPQGARDRTPTTAPGP